MSTLEIFAVLGGAGVVASLAVILFVVASEIAAGLRPRNRRKWSRIPGLAEHMARASGKGK
jgi:hypothetical protein